MADEQTIFDPSEMTLISYKCSNCNSEITVDLGNGYMQFENCGVCKAEMTMFSEVARLYERFLAKSKDVGSVRMKMAARPVTRNQQGHP